MQERIVRPSGELRYLESWGEVTAGDDGRPVRLLGICHDVTEQRRRRERAEALRDANDALTRTLDLEEVFGILLDSLAGFVRYAKGIVLLRNDESQLELGAMRGCGEAEASAIADELAVSPVLEEERTVALDGSWLAAPLRAGGQVIGLCAVQSGDETPFVQADIDWIEALTAQAAAAIENARLHDRLQRHAAELEQRVAERTLDLSRAKEEAERANRAKSDFLAGISHELRTPMNAILGFAQLLELDELGGEQGDNVRQILTAGRHLLELITELLDIARIEAGELALSLEPVGVAELIVEATDLDAAARRPARRRALGRARAGDELRARGPAAAVAGAAEPARERGQVQPAGRDGRGRRVERRRGRDLGSRHRARDRGRGRRAPVRPVRAARARRRRDRGRRPRPRARAAARRRR